MRPDDLLEKAIEALKDGGGQGHPPAHVVEQTRARLRELSTGPSAANMRPRFLGSSIWVRLAAAAVVLVAAGIGIGRITSPRALTEEQVRDLEQRMSERIEARVAGQWAQAQQVGLVALRQDLDQRFEAKVNQVALQILAASNAATTRTLASVVEDLRASQARERQWMAASLGLIESDRFQREASLNGDMAVLASLTQTQARSTRDLVSLFANERLDVTNSRETDLPLKIKE
jgi:hypothetical protein